MELNMQFNILQVLITSAIRYMPKWLFKVNFKVIRPKLSLNLSSKQEFSNFKKLIKQFFLLKKKSVINYIENWIFAKIDKAKNVEWIM